MRMTVARMKTRIHELRNATTVTPGAGLAGPTVSVKMSPTTTAQLTSFVRWLEDKGVLIEGNEYEVQGAVAHSIESIRNKLRDLAQELPSDDPEQAAVAELREACRVFLNRHNADLGWDDFRSPLGDREWRALLRLRTVFAQALLDWYDNKGLLGAQNLLNRINVDAGRPGFLGPG
jgi:hypothetical protein